MSGLNGLIRLERILPAARAAAIILGGSLTLSGCGFFSSESLYVPPAADTNRIAKTASAQVGKKYQAGGASPQTGFDCSGLVWWSYAQNGVKLPRITVDQAKSGRSVPQKSVRPGDIVVFRFGDSPRGLHTGIYAGAGKFVHSPGRGKRVRLESIALPHWKEKLVSIRRIIR